ncbi:MAG: transcription antitermination factor NusB, partial [Bacteroidota bacterium]
MISRRNIRVKVMQCLYAVETGSGEFSEKEAVSLLKKYLEQTENLFLFCIFLITEVAQYAETDSRNRAGKHLPSEQDLNVNTKISENELVTRITSSTGFMQSIKDRKLALLVDRELVKKIYLGLAASTLYQDYISAPERDKKFEKEIISYLFTDLIMADESITDAIEELFIDWDDDAEM